MGDRTPTFMAYEGKADCTDLRCRRMIGPDPAHPYPPGCMGWHCAVCDEPSSMYGHRACHTTDTPVNP